MRYALVENESNKQETAKKAPSKYASVKYSIDVRKALTLRLKNHLSYGAIARELGASENGVYKALTPFIDALSDPVAIQAFEQNEGGLISAAKMKIYSFMVGDDALKKASLNNLAYAYSQIDTVKRLEEGKATAHIAYADYGKKIDELDDEEQELRKHRDRLLMSNINMLAPIRPY